MARSQCRLQGFYLLWPGFPRRFVYCELRVSLPQGISTSLLGSYLFARHYSGNRWFTFSSSGYLDGSVPRVPLLTLCVHVRIPDLYFGCVPAFGYLRILCLFATPRSFSQLTTSFFGAWCHWHPPYALYSFNLRLFPLLQDKLPSIVIYCFAYTFFVFLS